MENLLTRILTVLAAFGLIVAIYFTIVEVNLIIALIALILAVLAYALGSRIRPREYLKGE